MKEITIKVKPNKGEDGKKVTTIRMSEELFDKIDKLAIASGQSRNYVINKLLTESVAAVKIVK